MPEPDTADPDATADGPRRSPASGDGVASGGLGVEARRGIEAILFLADEPVDVATLAEAVDADPQDVEAELERLAREHQDQQRGTEVRTAAGGWRLYTSPAAKPAVERWALAGRTGRLTQAALETLAVIAYKQPIGRQEIGDIRGVNADGAVRSLVARGFVEEVGRDPGPGQAALFGTTRLLLERLGLGSLDELPDLTDFLPEAPAPDEPDLGALKEVRRRLAEGGELPSRGIGGRSASETNTGVGSDEPDDDDVMPPPVQGTGTGRDDAEIGDLTDRLEQAARNAMDRLRAAVATEDTDDGDDDPGDAAPPTEDADDGDRDDAGPPGEDVGEAAGEDVGAADLATGTEEPTMSTEVDRG